MTISSAVARNMTTTLKGQAITCKAMDKSLRERIDLVTEVVEQVSAPDALAKLDIATARKLRDAAKEFAVEAEKMAKKAAIYHVEAESIAAALEQSVE